MSNPPLPPGASSPRDPEGRDPSREHPPTAASGATRGTPRAPDTGQDGEAQPSRDRDSAAAPGPAAGGSTTTMALILHSLTFLCCCNVIFGVPGIVFAVRAAHQRDRGRHSQAETLIRYSWYCLGAAGVMFAVMAVLFLVMLTRAGSWIDGIAPVTNW